MTDHHAEAWNHVKPHLFGQVIEVTTRPNWGFYHDDDQIVNVTADEYFWAFVRTGTIILHILQGEGMPKQQVSSIISKAQCECVKLIILEHNPEHEDWPDLQPVDWMESYFPTVPIIENWGRNMLIANTTMEPLHIPQLSNDYVARHLPHTYVTPQDEGIDPHMLVYTHTSESPIEADLSDEQFMYWVIGGGLAYESMHKGTFNILIDSVLRQVLYCALLHGVERWKLKMIWPDVDRVKPGPDYREWRKVKPNGVRPDLIMHKNLRELNTECLTYVSTVPGTEWQHLPYVLESVTIRNKPQLCQRRPIPLK